VKEKIKDSDMRNDSRDRITCYSLTLPYSKLSESSGSGELGQEDRKEIEKNSDAILWDSKSYLNTEKNI
jgi:hypothetical protein